MHNASCLTVILLFVFFFLANCNFVLHRLNHPNVVKACEVPPEMDFMVNAVPHLAMEYCSGGDLRKVSDILFRFSGSCFFIADKMFVQLV